MAKYKQQIFLAASLLLMLAFAWPHIRFHQATSQASDVFSEIFTTKPAQGAFGIPGQKESVTYDVSVGSNWWLYDCQIKSGERELLRLVLYTGDADKKPRIWLEESSESNSSLLVFQPFFGNPPSVKYTCPPGLWKYTKASDGSYALEHSVISQWGAWILNPIPIHW